MTDTKQTIEEKFPIDTLWECRDGGKAKIVDYCDKDYQFIAYLYRCQEAYHFEKDGNYLIGEIHDFDLISEWKEPRRCEGWVNVYKLGGRLFFGNVHKSKKDAMEMLCDPHLELEGYITTHHVVWTEGEDA